MEDKAELGYNHYFTNLKYWFKIIRPYWRTYYPDTNAIIYVVDSQDKDRLEISK